MSRSERRRSVRMRPIHDLPATAELLGPGDKRTALRIVDVSVGGIALAITDVLNAEPGTRFALRLSLSQYGVHEVTVDVRWCVEAVVGAQYVDLTKPATAAVRAYVAELLERGAPS